MRPQRHVPRGRRRSASPSPGVRVGAGGGFDTESWVSRGITYAVEIDSPASPDELAKVLARVDEVAEIPRALRAGMSVERAHE